MGLVLRSWFQLDFNGFDSILWSETKYERVSTKFDWIWMDFPLFFFSRFHNAVAGVGITVGLQGAVIVSFSRDGIGQRRRAESPARPAWSVVEFREREVQLHIRSIHHPLPPNFYNLKMSFGIMSIQIPTADVLSSS